VNNVIEGRNGNRFTCASCGRAVSDVCILHDGRFYALELKASGCRSTEAQIAFRDAVNAAGGFAAEAVGLDAALACLRGWNLLRGDVQ